MKSMKLKSPFWSLFAVALLVGLPCLCSEAQAYRGGGGGYHGGGGFSGGSFRGGGGYAEGPRGGGVAEGPRGGRYAQTARGGQAYRSPYGGGAARGAGGGTAYHEGAYHGETYHGGTYHGDLSWWNLLWNHQYQPECECLRQLERLLWLTVRWCSRRGCRGSGGGLGCGGSARRGRSPVSGGSDLLL